MDEWHGLSLVPRQDGTGAMWAVDETRRVNGVRDLVGSVIPSDVYPGKWRASVMMPGEGGSLFIRVATQGEEEKLVERPQVGTETFKTPEEALNAIARHKDARPRTPNTGGGAESGCAVLLFILLAAPTVTAQVWMIMT
ncbi:hypothetical protein [Nocardiopsis sp. YSL2]|uniref:hypothetical protein n=1 Tax=Nocardiopsis sp. YSL2 TaxID=2939492 RepID=UPI0026F41D25|nr:hypothetical protein [Nocardiopsis sp. YSL2]